MTLKDFKTLFMKAKCWIDDTQATEIHRTANWDKYYDDVCDELLHAPLNSAYKNPDIKLFMFHLIAHIKMTECHRSDWKDPNNFVNSNIPRLKKAKLRLVV